MLFKWFHYSLVALLCNFNSSIGVKSENVNDIVYKIVETEYGGVRGIMNETILHKKKYHGFRGIPFAKPAIGELRFKAPEPVDPWRPKIIDAFKYGKGCSQLSCPDCYGKLSNSDEDCLFVNVFVPGDKQYLHALLISVLLF